MEQKIIQIVKPEFHSDIYNKIANSGDFEVES